MYKTKTLLALLCIFFMSVCSAQVEQVSENFAGMSRRLQFEIDNAKDPNLGYVPAYRLVEAYTERKKRVDQLRTEQTNLLSWVERGPYKDVVGPSNGNTRPGNGITAGRVRAVWEDLSDPTGKTVWVGGIDGGLWKTNDITARPANWVPINDFFGNLAVASICQDPTNTSIMYFATGEKAINADAVRGAGVWRSLDNGVTWDVMPGTSTFHNVSKIVCDAAGNLYLGNNSTSGSVGMQRYTKATDTWTNITPTGLATRISDLTLSSTGRLHISCGYYNTPTASAGYRYTDNPATVSSSTWSSPSTTFPTQYAVVMASNGNTLYALSSNSGWNVSTIYKSTNGGVNWAATGSTPSFTSGQAWYCMAVGIDPNNANNVIVGSLDCYKTTNGGSTWTKISNWVGTTGQYVHADQQIILWRSNNQVLIGSDGGVDYSADGGVTIKDRNEGLRIKQFYSVAIHPTSTDYMLAGAQDNGTHQLNAPGLASSVEVTGGDGAFVHIDKNQPQYQWGAYVYNQYRRSTNGGGSWSSVNYSSSAGRFINPTDYDDVNNIMYASGNANAFVRWSNAQSGGTFTSVAMSGLVNGKVSALKVSPYTNNTVFFAGGGSGVTPSLIRAANANGTPTYTNIISSGMQITSANISCVELGTSDQHMVVVFSNYGINNVWVTSNGGSSWAQVDGNLPDMPVRWAMFYPGDNTKMILATETGIWQTDMLNGSSTIWNPETGFPNVRTDMLEYRATDNTLVAATHGRGIFTTTLGATPPPPTCGTVSGLVSSSVTTNSATISWTALSGANNYDVDYKLNSTSTWTNAATATTSTSVNLSGLSESSLYDWRVRANCTDATGNYTAAQFSTTGTTPTCGTVTGLASSSVTTSSATVSWSTLSGANTYDVSYKLSTSGTWINAATATAATSVNLSGLTAGSLYDWRVRANCTDASGVYSQAQFTTTALPSCGTVSGLNSSSVTDNSATVSWSALSGANSYDVDYKLNSSSTWVNAAAATSTTSVDLTGLVDGSLYDWRVRANCTGSTGAYSTAQFTTVALSCQSAYDNETSNNTISGAATIPFNTNITGLISPANDVDNFKFVISTGGTITLTLTTLPANYELKLLNSVGSQLAISKNNGTNNETINYTTAAGTYYAQVYGFNKNTTNSTNCYTLKVQLGTATQNETPGDEPSISVKVFPNPATDKLTVYVVGDSKPRKVLLYDGNGKSIYNQGLSDMFTTLDIQKLPKGVYYVRIADEKGNFIFTEKLIKN